MEIELTDKAVRQLAPADKEYAVRDTRLPGLGVRVKPSGYKTFIWRHDANGHSRRVTLGRFPHMTTAQARQAWHDLQGQAGKEKKKRAAPRFDAFVAGPWRDQKFARLKPSGQRSTASYVKSRLLPAFGKMHLDEIDRAKIVRWFEGYSKTYPGGANRSLEILMTVLEFALVCGHIDANPAKGIKKNPKKTLNRFLSTQEIRRLSEVLSEAEQDSPTHKQGADIVRLLLLTGCRHREITYLRWDMVRGDTIKFPDTKTGPRDVHLSTEVKTIIKAQPRTKHPWVFPSKTDPARPRDSVQDFWAVVRKRAGIEDVRVHDLRHTFASHAVMKGVGVPMVSKLLGHRKTAMTLRYTHVADKDAEEAAERIGVVLWEVLQGRGKS